MEKNERIILGALELFSEKGYFSTSVQEIATSCGISKGSFYKYFNSKEDLLIEVYRYNHQQKLLKVKEVKMDDSLSVKEKFIKIIALEIEGMDKNREYFMLLHKVVPVQENNKMLPLMKRTKAGIIRLHKEWLQNVYGEAVDEHIWDYVLFLQGMMREFIILMEQAIKTIEIEEVAKEIVHRLDVLVEHRDDLSPLLLSEVMDEYERIAQSPNEKTSEEERHDLLLQLKVEVQDLTLPLDVKEEVLSAFQLLEEELNKKIPRLFLVKSLIIFLKENTSLYNTLASLEKLFLKGNKSPTKTRKEGV